MKSFFSPEPVLFFNSASSSKYPGNTIEAMENAFNNGTDVVCFNIQFSKDKVIMAISEAMLETLCESAGAVADFTKDELKRFDAGYRFADENGNFPFRGGNYKFATLEEILNAFPDKRFNITIMIKDDELVRSYVSIINKYKAADRILTSSMYGKNIKLFRKLLPQSATAFSLAGIIGVYALFKSGLLYFIRNFKADAYQAPEAIGASYLSNGALIDQLHKKGIKVHVWNVTDRIQLKRVFGSGADGFMVNDVLMAKEFLSQNSR